MDKYTGFDIDSKKTVACVVQEGESLCWFIWNDRCKVVIPGRLPEAGSPVSESRRPDSVACLVCACGNLLLAQTGLSLRPRTIARKLFVFLHPVDYDLSQIAREHGVVKRKTGGNPIRITIALIGPAPAVRLAEGYPVIVGRVSDWEALIWAPYHEPRNLSGGQWLAVDTKVVDPAIIPSYCQMLWIDCFSAQ